MATESSDPSLQFGVFGGRYVAETLMPAVEELAEQWPRAWADPAFVDEYRAILRDYAGRPSTLTEASRLAAASPSWSAMASAKVSASPLCM